ncbi:hypothetical protein SAMN05443247_03124 [Bradyrhizobium erythrophlei]|nr:hypothetical protein SAMN05443247_03124 [Bradyrhizobium erythrophlei]
MAEDRTSTPVIALSPTEARFVTKPPLGAKTIKHALQSGELVAHRCGVNAFITVPDLLEWITNKEDYRHARKLHASAD